MSLFASQTPRANLLTFALLLGLAQLALFVVRTQYEAFYQASQYYALGLAILTLLLMACYLCTLQPHPGYQEQGTLNWYFGRAVSMALLGTLLGASLSGLYAYQGDESFLSRQLEWEANSLRTQHLPEDATEFLLESSRHEQALHLEEVVVLFFGGLSGFAGSLGLAIYFSGRRRRRNGRSLPSSAA